MTKKLPLRLLICALALVLIGSLLANLFNTGMWSVKVSRISFTTDNGTLSGLLYSIPCMTPCSISTSSPT